LDEKKSIEENEHSEEEQKIEADQLLFPYLRLMKVSNE